jgi:hypothetical protein
MNKDGYILNDCHAEVLAKWALNKYFFNKLIENKEEIFEEIH